MAGYERHIPEQDLLLTADGEADDRRAEQVRVHLEHCWECRARMAEIDQTIVAYTQARHTALNAELPPATGPRALLRARIGELAAERAARPGRWLPRFAMTAAAAALCGLLLTGVALRLRQAGRLLDDAERAAIPDRRLTPGATRAVRMSDMCSMAHEEVVKEVPDSLRRQVFAEYGIAGARTADYEVDYLITPGLGGADDIHNLWPEPYRSPVWNARVKDALEERLHAMVCTRQIDLETAQREIATDWIAAYRKYFHTEMPVAGAERTDEFAVRVAVRQPKIGRAHV